MLKLITFASLASAASVPCFHLRTESTNKTLDHLGVSPIHEGAGINYASLGKGDGSTFQLTSSMLKRADANQNPEEQGGFLYPTAHQEVQVLEIGVLTDPKTGDFQKGFSDVDNKLAVNGTTSQWAACWDIGDPYNYHTAFLTWVTGHTPDNCRPVTVNIYYDNCDA
uniref:ARAD1B08932p n=1 Tax=Blastobotrys adeninivorans TaxID=409370 RepID=A0A060TAQ9_BLAAD